MNSETPQPQPAFDPSNPGGNAITLQVYDSLGAGHPASVYFTRNSPTQWTYTVTLPPGDTTTPPATVGDPVVVQGTGTLTFDVNGVLQAGSPGGVTFNFSGGAAPGQAVTLDFGTVGQTQDTMTQFRGQNDISGQPIPVTPSQISQDGFAPGNFVGLEFAVDGTLLGKFDNGQSIPMAQLALADFASIEGLAALGANEFGESSASGQPLIGTATSGQFGDVAAGNLEGSNVDLSGEFVRLIINQRAFQANTRTISTTSELLGLLVTLGQ